MIDATISDVRAMVSRAAGRKVRIEEHMSLAAIVGLATLEEDYLPGTARGNAAATQLIEAICNVRDLQVWRRERPRTAAFCGSPEYDTIDAKVLALYRMRRGQGEDFAGLHIAVRQVLRRAADGLRATRRWARRRRLH